MSRTRTREGSAMTFTPTTSTPPKTKWALRVTPLLLVLLALPARAHEKWFYEGDLPAADTADLHQAPVKLGVAITLASVAACYALWRWRRRRDVVPGPRELGAAEARRADFYALVPALLGIHLAVPLLVCGSTGHWLSPNNALSGAWRPWLGVAQIGVALAVMYGAVVRWAAVVLVLVWAAGLGAVGTEAMAENLHYLGYAVFFFCVGRGPFSVDRMLFPRLDPAWRIEHFAVPALRVGLGLSLVTVAFTEKLANLHMATGFLRQHPLNFTAWMHVPMSDQTFIVCCGSVELFVGLMLAFGIFPRPVILIAWLPFNMTLSVFNWLELAGHLPFYGALALLLVWTPSERDRALWREGIRRGAGAMGKSPTTGDATPMPRAPESTWRGARPDGVREVERV